jgi:biotin carboxyl carrier protein
MFKHKPKAKLIAVSNDQKKFEFEVNNHYEFKHKRHKLNVELIEEADGFIILSCKGLRYPVEIVSQKQNSYEILINGVSYQFVVETPFSLKRSKILSKQPKSSSSFTSKAPMPGKILNVPVTEGQVVNRGEALLILEAMKMQNTIVAQGKGVIEKISVKAGDNVGKDEILMVLKNN